MSLGETPDPGCKDSVQSLSKCVEESIWSVQCDCREVVFFLALGGQLCLMYESERNNRDQFEWFFGMEYSQGGFGRRQPPAKKPAVALGELSRTAKRLRLNRQDHGSEACRYLADGE